MGIKKKDLLACIEDLRKDVESMNQDSVQLWAAHKAICAVVHKQNRLLDSIRGAIDSFVKPRPVGRPMKASSATKGARNA